MSGYVVLSELKEIEFERFEDRYRSRSDMLLVVPKIEGDEELMLLFSDNDKFGKEQATEIAKKMTGNIKRAVVVFKFEPKYVQLSAFRLI